MEEVESQKDSEKEKPKKGKSEEEFNKKIQKNQFKIMTTFKKIKNLYSDGIMPLIKHHKREVGDSLQNLMGEEDDNQKIQNLKNRKINKDMKTSKSFNTKSHMSENAQNLSQKIKFQINKVRRSQEDITALNALYLNNKYFPDEDPEQKNKNNNRYDDNEIKKEEKVENYKEALRKKKLRNNFEIIAKSYHKTLKDAFLKFNPEMNLNNLKMLIQISPTLRDDISKTKKEVDGDVKNVTDKKRYHKEYQRILQKNLKSKSTKLLDPKLYKSDEIGQKSQTTKNDVMGNNNKRKSSVILPNIGRGSSFVNNRDEMVKFELMKKLMKKDTKRFMTIMDEQFEQIYRLHNISQQINSYIGNENISKKIDNHLKDFEMHNYLNSLKSYNEAKNPVFKPKDYFASQKNKLDDLYSDLYINKLEKRVLDNERKIRQNLLINKAGYFNKMHNDMRNSLKEFDNNISSNGIKLEDNQDNNADTI